MPCRISLPKGGFDFNKLNIKDKILMSLLRLKLKMKKRHGQELSDDEKGMLAAYETVVDSQKERRSNQLSRVFENIWQKALETKQFAA